MATRIMSTNSGMAVATDGSRALNGSNDTVTKCRLATAKTTNSSPKGITISAVKNFRMAYSRRVERTRPVSGAGVRVGRGGFAVQPLAHFLPRLEKRHALLIDRHVRPGARIAPRARGPMLDRERAETAQFDPIAARQRRNDFVENGIHNILHIPLIEVRVVLGDALHQFGFDHRTRNPWRGDMHFRENALNCQDAKSLSEGRKPRCRGLKRQL